MSESMLVYNFRNTSAPASVICTYRELNFGLNVVLPLFEDRFTQ